MWASKYAYGLMSLTAAFLRKLEQGQLCNTMFIVIYDVIHCYIIDVLQWVSLWSSNDKIMTSYLTYFS